MFQIERLVEEVQSTQFWSFVWQAWRYPLAGMLVIAWLLRPGNRWILPDARPGLAAALGLALLLLMFLGTASPADVPPDHTLLVGMIGGCWGVSVILCMLALRWSEGRSVLAWLLLLCEVGLLAMIAFGLLSRQR